MRFLPLLITAALLAVLPASAAAAVQVRGDFDGDGRDDLAVGAPADSVQGQQSAGAVNVIYGTGNLLRARGDQQFTKAPQAIAGVPQPGARFGAALAAGDVDGDGRDDLAIGAPGEDVGGLGDNDVAGAVTVLYGSSGGLRTRPRYGGFNQNSIGIKGQAEARDEFGAALAMADFDGDGEDDLAIGVPGEDVGGRGDAGAVNVLYGTSNGLTEARDQLWTQNTRGIKGIAAAGARFGAALAAEDVSRNNRDELAIGIPGGRIGGNAGAGAVLVLYGRSGGLSSVDDLWSQDAGGIKGVAEADDGFGSALGIGDFDRNGANDLAVGVPREGVGRAQRAGAVNVLYGSVSGLGQGGDQLWTQDSGDVRSRTRTGELFGSALVAVDFSRNGADDLAIGVPNETIFGTEQGGAVNVLYGNPGDGLSDRANQVWHQNSGGIKGVAGRGDQFGSALGAGDYDGNGAVDLAVGSPFDSVRGFPNGGAVNVIYGSITGLGPNPDQVWTQATPGIQGAPGNDLFGSALADP